MSFKKASKIKYRHDFPGDYNFDFKDPLTLSRFVSELGKITPARISKLSLAQQKQVAKAIKQARSMALLPSGGDAYDTYNGPEPISPRPFEI